LATPRACIIDLHSSETEWPGCRLQVYAHIELRKTIYRGWDGLSLGVQHA